MKLKQTPTRITPQIVKMWEMLTCLWNIQHFERQVAKAEENMHKLDAGVNKYLPTYTQTLRDSYTGAITTFKERIEAEEQEYNQHLNELTLMNIKPDPRPGIPELISPAADDDIESFHHQRTCGGH